MGKKNNDMVRLVRASECEVDGDDICSAAFARRWRGFVVDVHRAFAILAQERAISFLHVFELCFMLSSLLCSLEALEAVLPRQCRHRFATTLCSGLFCGKSISYKDICSTCGVTKPGIKRLTTSSILSLPLTLIAHRPFLPWFDLFASSLFDLWEPGDRSFAQNG